MSVIVFDLDDTLYPERPYARSGLRAAGAWAARACGLETLGAVAVDLFDAGRRGDVFQAALITLGVEDPQGALVARLVEAYRHHVPVLELFPDVADVLPRLDRLGRLAVLTDGYLPSQRLKIEALGVDKIASPIIYTELLGRECWKPSAAGFMTIESMCAAKPAECIYVGDNPHKDFVAPKSRGWTTVRVRRPGTEHGSTDTGTAAHIELRDFTDLERWLVRRASRVH